MSKTKRLFVIQTNKGYLKSMGIMMDGNTYTDELGKAKIYQEAGLTYAFRWLDSSLKWFEVYEVVMQTKRHKDKERYLAAFYTNNGGWFSNDTMSKFFAKLLKKKSVDTSSI